MLWGACSLPTEVGQVPRPGQSDLSVNYKITPWTHMNPYEVVAQFKPIEWVARASTVPRAWLSFAAARPTDPTYFGRRSAIVVPGGWRCSLQQALPLSCPMVLPRWARTNAM